jgi:O-acetyl-ADP-ribose deacetylase (regulator of RNase III)
MPEARYRLTGGVIALLQGDITRCEAQAVVNAANSGLRGGGGVDGAIHSAAGPELVQACREIIRKQGRLPTGQAVITPGFQLKVDYVVHTVGPVWRDGTRFEAELLAKAYRNSLSLADEHGLTSIAFPAISCGVYGFPRDRAARIALEELRAGVNETGLSRIDVYLYSLPDWEIWKEQADALLS